MSNSLTLCAFITDKDLDSLTHLKGLLHEPGVVDITGTFASLTEAIPSIKKSRPQLLIVNISEDYSSLFKDLDRHLSIHDRPGLIFTSNLASLANLTFRYQPVDYLLKPVKKAELNHAILRFKEIRERQLTEEKINMLLHQWHPVKKLSFPTKNGTVFLDPDEIIYIHADWNYSEATLSTDKTELLSIGIGKIAALLPAATFIKVNRSLIINTKYLSRVSRKDKKIILKKNGEEYPLVVGSKGISCIEY